MGVGGRGPLAVASAFAVLLTGGLVTFTRQPPGCLTLVLASSQEKATLLSQIAGDYAGSRPLVDGQCVAIDVTRQASGLAEQSIARGWEERTDGRRPDIWSPASTTWTALLSYHLQARGKPNVVPEGAPILFKSPLVIGMPQPMAAALGFVKVLKPRGTVGRPRPPAVAEWVLPTGNWRTWKPRKSNPGASPVWTRRIC